jgi:2'-5' RNA ligase
LTDQPTDRLAPARKTPTTSSGPSNETGLIVPVPEVEGLVLPYRQLFDPSAPEGMPAHITLLYPFKPPEQIEQADREALRAVFASAAPFRLTFHETRRFPGVLYLAPEPEEPLRGLTQKIWHRFPGFPPYAGAFPEAVPHLTVAQLADETQLQMVAEEFGRLCATRLPIHAHVREARLMTTLGRGWQTAQKFRLG